MERKKARGGMERTSLLLPLDQLQIMKEHKEKTGVTLTHFVRVALDERIEKIRQQEVGK